MDAIDWVATKTPAMIVNLSLGSLAPAKDDDDPLAKFIDGYANTWGLIFSIAAGNDGCGPGVCAKSLSSPGIAYNGITVANWDHQRDSSGRKKGSRRPAAAVRPRTAGASRISPRQG